MSASGTRRLGRWSLERTIRRNRGMRPTVRTSLRSPSSFSSASGTSLSPVLRTLLNPLKPSNDVTVVPPQTAHFTLPSPNASNCPSPPLDPSCYLDPVPYPSLPLFAQDYIGLKSLEGEGRMVLGMCEGAHMEIDEECWEGIVSWLGRGDGRRRETAGRGLVWQG